MRSRRRHAPPGATLLAAVGPLQFEVVQYRLESEYGAESRLAETPWTLLRWVDPHPSLADPKDLIVATGVSLGPTGTASRSPCFQNDWTLRYFIEKNPGLTLRELPPGLYALRMRLCRTILSSRNPGPNWPRSRDGPLGVGTEFARQRRLQGAIVVDATSGRCSFEDHADEVKPPASMTKLMTFAVLDDRIQERGLHSSDAITATAADARVGMLKDSTSVWLKTGRHFRSRNQIIVCA